MRESYRDSATTGKLETIEDPQPSPATRRTGEEVGISCRIFYSLDEQRTFVTFRTYARIKIGKFSSFRFLSFCPLTALPPFKMAAADGKNITVKSDKRRRNNNKDENK